MLQTQKHLMVFLVVALAVGIGTQILLPFPFGLIIALSLFVAFPLLYRKYVFGNGSMFEMKTNKVKWVCITCGKSGSHRFCKRCGGNQFKAS